MLIETETFEATGDRAGGTGDADRVQIIKAVIEEIRPNLRRDGGDCELIEITATR